jgi:transposase
MPPGPKRGPAEQALGKSQGGWSTKVHLRAEGQGKPLTILLTVGQRHESTQFPALLDQGAVKRVGRGRPKLRPRRIVGDKGYSSRANREAARRRRMRVTIPHKANERRGRFDRVAYRQRNRIERLVNRCKHCRRLATRYEKCGENYRAMWVIAAILLWL